jgi:receptor protein-tyrosine kinase
MSRTSRDSDIKLLHVWGAIRRRLPIFVACLVLVPAVVVALSLVQRKEYTAKAVLAFRDPGFDQKLFGTSYVQNQPDPQRQAATNVALVSLPRVAALTAATLPGVTEQRVSSAVSVGSDSQSDLASIEATARDPRFAAKLANTFAAQYIGFRRDADQATIHSAEVPLQRQIAALPPSDRFGPLGQSLDQRLSQLGVLASLQTGGVELVQPAEVPRSPSSPQPMRNGLLGLFGGLVLAIGAVLLAERLDRRLRDPAEVEQIFERPALATLPRTAELNGADPALLSVPPPAREAFRMLWVNVRYLSLNREVHTVVLTSADRNDGKSTVAWGLAVAAASGGTRTLLMEADLRRPSLANRLALPSRDGLTNVLAGDVPSAQAIMRVPLPRDGHDQIAVRALDVLLAGPRPPDPTDLLQSRRMGDFLHWLQDRYELIVIDTPPAALVSDAIPLITLADGVVVVNRLGNTVREHARRLRQQLGHLDAPILGTVVNSVRSDGGYAGYGYGYGYLEAEAPVERASGTVPNTVARPIGSANGGSEAWDPHARTMIVPADQGQGAPIKGIVSR